MGKEEGLMEAQLEHVNIGRWELKRVGLHGTTRTPVYSLKNGVLEIRFLPDCFWFDLKWYGEDEYTYTGGDSFSTQEPHLFNLSDKEA